MTRSHILEYHYTCCFISFSDINAYIQVWLTWQERRIGLKKYQFCSGSPFWQNSVRFCSCLGIQEGTPTSLVCKCRTGLEHMLPSSSPVFWRHMDLELTMSWRSPIPDPLASTSRGITGVQRDTQFNGVLVINASIRKWWSLAPCMLDKCCTCFPMRQCVHCVMLKSRYTYLKDPSFRSGKNFQNPLSVLKIYNSLLVYYCILYNN